MLPLLVHQHLALAQVVAGVLSAVHYMLEYPREGICWPEEAAHTEVSRGWPDWPVMRPIHCHWTWAGISLLRGICLLAILLKT